MYGCEHDCTWMARFRQVEGSTNNPGQGHKEFPWSLRKPISNTTCHSTIDNTSLNTFMPKLLIEARTTSRRTFEASIINSILVFIDDNAFQPRFRFYFASHGLQCPSIRAEKV